MTLWESQKARPSCEGKDALLRQMDSRLDDICSKLSIIDEMKKAFECVICRQTAKTPVVSQCCQRVIGCSKCVKRWHQQNTKCPLCSVSNQDRSVVMLKGLDELMAIFRPGDNRDFGSNSPVTTDETSTSDDDFGHTLNFRN